MCFTLRKGDCKTRLLATSDIVCYKKMYRNSEEKGYKSAHLFFRYQNGETYSKKRGSITLKKRRNYIGEYRYEGHSQGFHSYAPNSSDATVKSNQYFGNVLVKCIIPKGTYFYYSQSSLQYFSESIKIVSVLGVTPSKKTINRERLVIIDKKKSVIK